MSDFPNGYLTTGNKPVINDAYKASEEYLKEQKEQDNLYNDEGDIYESAINHAFTAGAEWQKKQIMRDAVEVIVKVNAGGCPYIPIIALYDYDKNIPLAHKGEKVKVIIIKEE